MNSLFKRIISIGLILVLVLSVFAGCKTEEPAKETPAAETPSKVESKEEPEEPAEAGDEREHVKIIYSQPNTVLDNDSLIKDDPIKKVIEETVNIELEYDSGFDGYPDRVQTELIAGTGADLFPNYGQQELTSKWISDGVVVNIGEIVESDPERYPVLNKMFSAPEYKMYNQLYGNDPDATYAIYSISAAVNWAGAPIYNRKLMAEVDVEETPTTVDEFVEFANALGAKGISGWWPRNNTLTNLAEIDKTMFAPNGTTLLAPVGDPWAGLLPAEGRDAIEGEWKLMTTSEETKESLKVIADMYQKGGLDKGVGTKDDFAQAKAEFFAGQIGATNYGFSNWPQVKDFMDDYADGNPGADLLEDLALGTALSGSAGMATTYLTPYWVSFNWFIPVSAEHPDRVLDLIEFLASDEGQDLLFKGIEGQHYTMDGSEVVYNDDAWVEQGSIYNVTDGRYKYIPFAYLFAGSQEQLKLETTDSWYEAVLNPLKIDGTPDSPEKEYVLGVLDSYRDDVAVTLPPYFNIIQYPEEIMDSRVKLNEITLQYIPSFITGQKDIDAEWDDYVAEYEAAGASDLEAAFNSAKETAKADFEALAG